MATSAAAQAPSPAPTPAPIRHPNLFDLAGGGIHVTYSTTSITGKPIFSYHDATQSKQFTGDQIRTTDTEIGTLVTVTIFLTPDAGSTTFTLLLPIVTLRTADSAHIATYGITTLHRFSIIGPPQGQSESYTAHRLQGSASFVLF